MADPYTPFGYAMPRLMRPMGAPQDMPPTLTGVENFRVPAATPPPFGQRLRAAGMGVLNPFGLTPPPLTVMQSAGQTLTGEPLPEQPRTVSFDTGDPQSEAVGSLLGTGPAFRFAGDVVRGAANLAARAPKATAAAATTAGLTAPAATQERGPAQEAQSTREQIKALRTRQQALQKREADLAEPDPNDPKYKEAVKRVQRALGVEADGVWGGNTRAAAKAARAQTIRDREKVAQDLERQELRLRGLERDARTRQAEANTPTWQRFVERYSQPVGFALGLAGGPTARGIRTWNINRARARQVAGADALLTQGAADVPQRAASVNRFYAEGGGQPPFTPDPAAPLGFVPTVGQQGATGLYRPGNQYWNAGDTGRVAGFGAASGLAEWRLHVAQQELAAARAAAQEEPSEANIQRVQNAEVNVGLLGAGARAVEGAMLSYPTSAVMLRYRPQRPNVNQAEAEVTRLNQLLRHQPIDQAEVTRRRRARDFRIAPGTPVPQGEVERMVSPAGQKMLIRQPDGSWADEQGRPGTPRADWRRISSVRGTGLGAVG